MMENGKLQVGFEELKVGKLEGKVQKMECVKNMGMEGVKVEQWKSLVIRLIKTEKLKSSIIAPSRLTRLKLWALGATSVLLLCTCLVQLSTLNLEMRPRVSMFRSSHQHINSDSPLETSESSIFLSLAFFAFDRI